MFRGLKASLPGELLRHLRQNILKQFLFVCRESGAVTWTQRECDTRTGQQAEVVSTQQRQSAAVCPPAPDGTDVLTSFAPGQTGAPIGSQLHGRGQSSAPRDNKGAAAAAWRNAVIGRSGRGAGLWARVTAQVRGQRLRV